MIDEYKYTQFEKSAYQYLREFKDHPYVKEVMSWDNLIGIDIGCKYPHPILAIYHDFPFTTLYGIDKDPESTVLEPFLRALVQEGKKIDEVSVYGLYKYSVGIDDDCLEDRREYLTKGEFKKHIPLFFNTYAQNFLTEVDIIYDLVSCSHLLHFFQREDDDIKDVNTQKGFFNLMDSRLRPGGLIFIKVNHPDIIPVDATHYYRFEEQEFADLFSGYDTIALRTITADDGVNINRVFFGRKK